MGRKGRQNNFNHRRIGCLIILLGIGVFLALVMPPGFWWFALGVGLICVGICVMRGRF